MSGQRRHRFSAIDLFCGCGGLSLGLRKAGFKVLAAVDNDPLSVNTYRKNHRRTLLIEDDIQSVEPVAIMQQLNLKAGDLDLLAGCPPCQGFSTLRTFNGAYEIDEPMNDLVFEFARFARVLLPKTLMMENVPGLMNDDRLRRLRRRLLTLGYKCDAKVFDAARFGVAQRRQRMILIGSRIDRPAFAMPTRRKRTVAEALRVLLEPENSEDPIHNYPVRRTDHVLSLIRRTAAAVPIFPMKINSNATGRSMGSRISTDAWLGASRRQLLPAGASILRKGGLFIRKKIGRSPCAKPPYCKVFPRGICST